MLVRRSTRKRPALSIGATAGVRLGSAEFQAVIPGKMFEVAVAGDESHIVIETGLADQGVGERGPRARIRRRRPPARAQ